MTTNTWAIDYETSYSKDFGISEQGVWHYLTDERCDIYLVSIYSDTYEFVGRPEEAEWERIKKEDTIVAHNASFDRLVTEVLYKRGLAVVKELLRRWECTANLSCYCGGPRNLKDAGKVWLGVEVSKGMRDWMKGRTWKEAVKEGKSEELKDYALKDAKVCWTLWQKLSPRWPQKQRDLSWLTTTCGYRGVHLDTEYLKTLKSEASIDLFKANEGIPWIDTNKPTSPKALAVKCREVGIEPPASTDEKDSRCWEWEEKYGKMYPWIKAVRKHRKANKAIKLIETIIKRDRGDGKGMMTPLKYFGAVHTGRWAGDAGFNCQAIPKASWDYNIRKGIIPRPGKKFILLDLSNIEPRILAWLAEEWDLLDKIARGMDIYEAEAREYLGYTDPRPLKIVDDRLRQMCKVRVIQLGYQCGSSKFRTTASQFGLELSVQEAEKQVANYRSQHRNVVKLWYSLQEQFQKACLNKENFELELPSGRVITYWNCSGIGGWTAQDCLGGTRKKFYGGKFTENLCQAIGADIFGEGLLRLSQDSRYDILFHSHDGVVLEADIDVPSEPTREILTKEVSWARGLPMAAELKESYFYE